MKVSGINYLKNGFRQINSNVTVPNFHQTKSLQQDVFIRSKNINNVSFAGKTWDEMELGGHYNKENGNMEFGILSKNAEKIKLYLYDKPVHSEPIAEIEMERGKDDKWKAVIDKNKQKELNLKLNDKEHPIYYGYRVWGKNWKYDENWKPGSSLGFIEHVSCDGHRFNPNKLLTDPYAKEVSHDPYSPKIQGGSIDSDIYATGDDSYCKDSGPVAPKSIFLIDDDTDFGDKPLRKTKDDVIYEVHLKGLTELDKKIPEKYRGTYKGAAMKAKYLKQLGVTMVEFLPIQEFQNDSNTGKGGMENYWGYMTNQFFAPDKKYSSDKTPGGSIKEFKEMVKAFHDEGIKVCMDVVYNHTGEGGLWQNDKEKLVDKTSLYSLRGLDSAYYYEPSVDKRYFYDVTGCGANYNIANEGARDLVIDSIKYWSDEMGVDAFRFDLAPVLGNTFTEGNFGFNAHAYNGLFDKLNEEVKIRDDSSLSNKGIDLIAEPWTCNSYNAGEFPDNWKEWNDKYRNVINKMGMKPDSVTPGNIADVICGSKSRYNGGYTRAINYTSSHDGLTQNDYFEGQKNKFNLIKNNILSTMIAKGTPMILGGDEMLRTQRGNDNAHNQDNEISYLDWTDSADKKKIRNFMKRAIEFRTKHPALRDSKYFSGKDNNNNGLKDVTWIDKNGKEIECGPGYMDVASNDFLGFRLDESEASSIDSSIYVAINKGHNSKGISLPNNMPGKAWYNVACTDDDSMNSFVSDEDGVRVENEYEIPPQTIAMFIEK